MATYQIWTLAAANVTVSVDTSGNGAPDPGTEIPDGLSGGNQGAGTHLSNPSDGNDRYITLDNNGWIPITINDNGSDDDFADNDRSQRLASDITLGGTNYSSGRIVEAEYQLVLTDGTNNYTVIGFNIREPGSPFGNTYGSTEGLAFLGGFPPVGVPLRVASSSEGPSGSSTPATDYAVPPCFTPGTLIETSDGPRPIEALRVGDLVLTRDQGPQPIRWAGFIRVDSARLAGNPRMRPILIKRGALGPDLPCRDMRLSRQHRVLLEDWRAEVFFGNQQVLAAAAHLVNDSSILHVYDLEPVTYHHIMFDAHQIIRADGIWTESFRPGPASVTTLGRAAQEELFDLFPALRDMTSALFPPVRPLLRGWEAAVLSP